MQDNKSAPLRSVQIHSGNATERIDDAVHTITHCYDEWHEFAKNEAQVEQNTDAYWDAIDSQVRAVIEGMVFDED